MSPRKKDRRHRPLEMETLEDRRTMSVAAVSLRVDGKDTGNVGATFSDQSATGRYVVFRSLATNLVAGQQDPNFGTSDIFRRDRLTGKTELVSAVRRSTTKTGNGPSFNAYISPNGRWVAFESSANNLVPGDTNSQGNDIFVRDMTKKTTFIVNLNRQNRTTSGADNSIRESDQTDGRFVTDNGRVVFQSNDSNLVAGDNNNSPDVFVRDVLGRKTFLANVNSNEQTGNGKSEHGVLSANGRFVAFESRARNLDGPTDNFNTKIFLRDLTKGTTKLVSNNDLRSAQIDSAGSFLPQISANGLVVTFLSDRRLSTVDEDNSDQDVYVRDIRKAKPDLVSISTTNGPANSTSFDPNISDDGRFVVFSSFASNLATTDKDPSTPQADNKDVFQRNVVTGKTTLVSFNFQGTRSAFGESRDIAVSSNGRFVTWESQSLNLVRNFRDGSPGNGFAYDIFRRDMVTRKTALVNGRLGSAVQSSNEGANFPVISADGRYVTFHSTSTNLIRRDTNSGNGGRQTDVFASAAAYRSPQAGEAATSAMLAADEPTGERRGAPDFFILPVEDGDASVGDDTGDPMVIWIGVLPGENDPADVPFDDDSYSDPTDSVIGGEEEFIDPIIWDEDPAGESGEEDPGFTADEDDLDVMYAIAWGQAEEE